MKNYKYEKHFNNISILITTVIVFCVFAVSLVFYYNHTIVNDGNLYEIQSGKNSNSAAWQIDSVELTDGVLHLIGWSFFAGKDISNYSQTPNLRVLLAETENYEKVHYYSKKYNVPRQDVNDYYDDSVNYTYCGFDISINISNEIVDEKEYEVLIQPDERRPDLIRPYIYINDGQLTVGKLLNDVEETDIAKIVDNGILRVYRADIGLYIYQYDWKLYFILDNHYLFDEWNHIGNNVSTNHFELLPADRQKYKYASLDFNLSSCEITSSIDAGNYRVCVYEIPTDYPITYMSIGQWSSTAGWGWMSSICPGILNQ